MNQNEEYLSHHGILGQKWGVRRYQNFDGSYTQAGLKRYNDAKAKYDKSRAAYKDVKSNPNASKIQKKHAKGTMKIDKKQMDKHYKHLKTDMQADKGKELYRNGRTITGRHETLDNISKASALISVGSQFAAQSGLIDRKVANIASIGSLATSGATKVASIISQHGDKQLRAYYSHTSKY